MEHREVLQEDLIDKLTVISENLCVELLDCVLFNGVDDTLECFGISHLSEQEINQELVEIVIQCDKLLIIEFIDFSDEFEAIWINVGMVCSKEPCEVETSVDEVLIGGICVVIL